MHRIYETPLRIELIGSRLFVNGNEQTRSTRKLSELKDVMMSDIDISEHGDLEMYYVFRNIFKSNGIRYDNTLIPDRRIAGECAKTYGHCHPIAEKNLSYPEIYQVLTGEAVFILQTESSGRGVDVIIVDAKKGDVVLIPPNYCHVSINAGSENLLLGNAVADEFESDYTVFKENHGAAYYYSENGELIHNTNYFIAKNKRITANELNSIYNFKCNDILTELYSNPKKFEFLKKPSLL